MLSKWRSKAAGSLVSNILQKSNTLNQKSLDIGTQNLCKKAAELKEEMYEHVRQRYVEFQSYVQSTEDLWEKLREVDNEYKRLDTKISVDLEKKIVDSADKRQEIEDSLRGVQEKMAFVQRLASIHEELQASKRNLVEGDLTETARKLQAVSKNMNELAALGCEAKVFTRLQEELAVLISEADQALLSEWNNQVFWRPESATKNPSLSTTLETELRLPSTVDAGSEEKSLIEIVSACKMLDTWPRIRSVFAKKFLHLAIKPLILHNTTLGITRQVEAGEGGIVIGFAKVEETTTSIEEQLSSLYAKLATFLKVVGQILPEVREEWMRGIGEVVCHDTAQLIIDHCLATSVPKTQEELQQYEQVKLITSDFESGLVELGLAEAGFNKLSDFTQNIQVYYEEQKRKNLLETARSILKKSIHNTEILASPETTESLPCPPDDQKSPQDEGDPAELNLVSHEDQLKDLGVTFPSCAVSKCIKEFVELVHETLRACYAKETDEEKMAMFSTVRDMIDLYRAVFPVHHKEDIASIPAAAAVYYNNCMYIVHHLVITSSKIQQYLTPHATFVDLILFVRRMGEDAFQTEMKKQRDSVLRTLKTFGNFTGVSEEDKRDEVYRGVRQGLFQITQLSRVYKDTLPAYVHKDAVGNLLDVLISYIVKGILALEDIVSSDATELHQILVTVIEKGPSVMQWSDDKAKDIPHHCPSWEQLQELAFILDARLHGIVERWGQGKGSLAKNFKAAEVRNLIKALFTNTDRRAAALSKITVSA